MVGTAHASTNENPLYANTIKWSDQTENISYTYIYIYTTQPIKPKTSLTLSGKNNDVPQNMENTAA